MYTSKRKTITKRPGRKVLGVMRTALPFILIFASCILLVSAALADTVPVLTTDKADYMPNETVHFTGTGFVPLETYALPVMRPDGSVVVLDSETHLPIGGWDLVTADEYGSLAYDYLLNGVEGLYEARAYPAVWALGADGSGWDEVPLASVTFTDATNEGYDFTQCQNDDGGANPVTGGTKNDGIQDPCHWVSGSLGSNNSVYQEGDVVPHRTLRVINAAGAHWTQIEHSFYNSSKSAYTYDFFASPDATLGDQLEPCNDALPLTGNPWNTLPGSRSNCYALADDVQVISIPTESKFPTGLDTYTYPFVAGAETNALADGVNRNLWISCGAVVNGVFTVDENTQCTDVTIEILGHTDKNGVLISDQNGPPTSDDYTNVQVNFTTQEPNTIVSFWVGAHLAKESYWNYISTDPAGYQKYGAATAAGASFHVVLVKDDEGSLGSQDNQMQASTVLPSGEITIIKDDTTNSNTEFTFTGSSSTSTPISPSSFTLSDPNNPSYTFQYLASGGYQFAETIPSSWTLENIECTSSLGTSSFNYSSPNVSITLGGGDSVTCTFTDSPNVPTITTSATAEVTVGDDIQDTASINGLISPDSTGNITFYLYSDDTCSTLVDTSYSVAVTGDGNYSSGSYTTMAAGSYYWIASFSGDGNNEAVSTSCGESGETSVVNKASPSLSTQLKLASDSSDLSNPIALGTEVYDTATLSGAFNPADTSTITYKIYNDNACSDLLVEVTPTPDTLSGGVIPDSDNYTFNNAGSYWYQAHWSGDTNNEPATSVCTTEPVVVSKASPDISTSAVTDVTVGDDIHDTATMSGLVNPTGLGTITFKLYSDDACTEPALFTSVVTGIGANDSYNSANYTTTAVGSFYWIASFSGDANNEAASTKCKDAGETSVVNKAQLSISTTVHSDEPDQALVGNLGLGEGAHDSATVTEKVNDFALPGVTFYFFDKGVNCKDFDIFGGTELNTVSPDASGIAHPSTSKTNLAAGTYNFMAVVASNDYYEGATSACEPFTVDKATPTITTEVHDANHMDMTNGVVSLGTPVHDSASLGGKVDDFSFDGTATVTYNFYTNISCTGAPTSSQVVTVGSDGSVPESTPQTLAVGEYCYQAVYSGNDNYKEATSDIEPFTVVRKSIVTDTGLCTFDGDQFRLLFTPDVKNNPLSYKLTASNPGQFYYNVFFNDGTGGNTIKLEIPYPFVTQGAQPIHAYSDVGVTTNGETCLTLIDGTEIAHQSDQITLGSYSDTNGDGVIGFGDTVTVAVTFTSPSGFAYVNIHVDYGLKGTNNYYPNGNNDAITYPDGPIVIPDDQSYTFSFSDGDDGSYQVSSYNAFKHSPGVGILTFRSGGEDPEVYTGQDIMVRLVIPKSVKNAPGPWLEASTDEDGWAMIEYKHIGKPTNYKFEVYKGDDLLVEKTVQLHGNEFEEVLLYLDESTGGDPVDPTVGTIHVADLQGSSKVSKRNWNATVTISILDDTGASVQLAQVSGRWIVSGAEIPTYCETDATGACSLTLSKLDLNISGVSFVVTDVFLDGSTYDAENSVTSVDIPQ